MLNQPIVIATTKRDIEKAFTSSSQYQKTVVLDEYYSALSGIMVYDPATNTKTQTLRVTGKPHPVITSNNPLRRSHARHSKHCTVRWSYPVEECGDLQFMNTLHTSPMEFEAVPQG